MRVSIAAKFGEQFLQLRRASFKEHSNAAISRLLNSDENLSRSMLSELAPFIMRHKEQMKTTSVILSSNFGILDVIWRLVLRMHKESVLCFAQERFQSKRRGAESTGVQARSQSLMCSLTKKNKVETGTAILCNSSQLDYRVDTTRDTKCCGWLHQLDDDNGEDSEEKTLDT